MFLALSAFEARHILHWASSTIEDKMHWGDGATYFPGEEDLIKKLKKDQDEIMLEDHEVDMVYFWSISACGSGNILLGEDEFIINRLLKFYSEKYRTLKENGLKEKIKTLENILAREYDGKDGL